MCNLGSMDFLIMRNHDYLFIIANRGLKSIRAFKHKKGIVMNHLVFSKTLLTVF